MPSLLELSEKPRTDEEISSVAVAYLSHLVVGPDDPIKQLESDIRR